MEILKKLIQYNDMTEEEAAHLVALLLSEGSEVQKSAHLIALKMKGETADELSAIARALIHSTYSQQSTLADSICVCGTGGDHSGSFNISTTVSFIIAAAGLNVLKHGNRSITSKTGSIDILDALDIPVTPIKEAAEQLKHQNLIFLSAADTYPLMKYIQPTRKELAIPTVMNLMGPMIHPYQLDYQVMGVYDQRKTPLVAEALQKLGRKRAIVLHGAGGMDEATLAGDNLIYEVAPDRIEHYTLNAMHYGLQSAPNHALQGGNKDENKKITLDILAGKETGPKRDVVVFNAAIALYTAGYQQTITEAVSYAQQLIDSGEALKILKQVSR